MFQDTITPLFTADISGLLKFIVIYGGALATAIFAIRKWVNEPAHQKVTALRTEVKYDLDGVGTKVNAIEIQLGRLEVAQDKIESEVRNNQRDLMSAISENGKLLARLNERTEIMLDARMQNIQRVANELDQRNH